MQLAIGVLVGLAAGTVVAALVLRLLGSGRLAQAREESKRLTEEAQRSADSTRREAQVEAKELALKLRADVEQELKDKRAEIIKIEERVVTKEEEIDRKLTDLERREQGFADRETHLKQLQEELKAAKQNELKELERISGMTVDEAKRHLLERSEELVRHEMARMVRQLEEEARTDAKRRARNLVADALQRVAASHAAETTVSIVDLPSDDMKGRIIGREGRNIRALETATGVELIVDDTPGAIILSSFDPFRREVARQTIERLIADGRIHPARIEEVVEKVKAELEETVRREGETAAFELGLYDMHPEILKLMGRLKFRTSYGQNVLNHSREVAFLAGIMAKEIGLNSHVAVRAAFLHDIGKAIDRDLQGTHLELGLEFLRKHGESEPVLQAVAAHHMDIDWPSLEAMIVQAADAISAARPGARRDILESYVKRLEKLEK